MASAALKRTEDPPAALVLLGGTERGFGLLALFHRLTRKRVNQFFHRYWLVLFVFRPLMVDIRFDRLFIASDYIRIVSSAP